MIDTYLFLLHVEVVNDDTNEEVESEEGPHDDECHEVPVGVEVGFSIRLLAYLQRPKSY